MFVENLHLKHFAICDGLSSYPCPCLYVLEGSLLLSTGLQCLQRAVNVAQSKLGSLHPKFILSEPSPREIWDGPRSHNLTIKMQGVQAEAQARLERKAWWVEISLKQPILTTCRPRLNALERPQQLWSRRLCSSTTRISNHSGRKGMMTFCNSRQDGHCHPWQKVNIAQTDATRVVNSDDFREQLETQSGLGRFLGAGDPSGPKADNASPAEA